MTPKQSQQSTPATPEQTVWVPIIHTCPSCGTQFNDWGLQPPEGVEPPTTEPPPVTEPPPTTTPPPTGSFGISGISGTLRHNESVVLTGSFGSKPLPGPMVWDDQSGSDPKEKWPIISPTDSHYENVNFGYYTPEEVGGRIPLVHTRNTKYATGCHRESGPYIGSSVGMWVRHDIQKPDYCYWSAWFRHDTEWAFGNGDPNDYNMKIHVYTQDWFYYDAYWYAEYQNGEIRGLNSEAVLDIYDSAALGLDPDITYGNHPTNPMKKWQFMEMEYKITDRDDGFVRIWLDGVLALEYHGVTDDKGGTQRYHAVGGYARDLGPKNRRYFSDVYLDNSRAKVVLGDSASWGSCTRRFPQPCSAWSDGQITFNLKLGTFGDSDQAWLYVMDSNGEVTPAHQVQLGQ